MDKIYIVVNPVSANKTTAREWPLYEKALSDAGFEFDAVLTEYPGHAAELTRKALKLGYKTIMSVGGDGTMNEVVNGFFDNDRLIDENSRLIVFSRGTGCDFIRTLGINKNIEDLLAILKRNREKQIDVGRLSLVSAEGNMSVKYFLNIADIGIGAETADRVNKNSKRLSGFLSFMLGTLSTVVLYKNQNFEVVIDDNIHLNGIMNSVIVANGKYFGGGMMVAPDAVMDDGVFDIIILGNLSKPDIIKSFPLIYKGKHMNHPKLKYYRGRKVKVTSGGKGLIEVDGEIPGRADAVFELMPKAFKILV
ncbi:MAG TPA: diacylglycerol kinase family lipid kinase [Bacillota bacterium]|nr:diacylglycerol kinase family lipid kinase [Bacillota bacterium]HQE65976.1 diacylglycerol kinase family lipid kinase [Bacillota bacterium]HQI15562.1 diacylglycerol kinase family lipid kinase [Bacillota bacterium]HQJ36286.1 diacylglycerol kinase family lipid kinase [Bacillota bacterium]